MVQLKLFTLRCGSTGQKGRSSAMRRTDQKLHQIVGAVTANYSTVEVQLWPKVDRVIDPSISIYGNLICELILKLKVKARIAVHDSSGNTVLPATQQRQLSCHNPQMKLVLDLSTRE